jgi:hypothetical protein
LTPGFGIELADFIVVSLLKTDDLKGIKSTSNRQSSIINQLCSAFEPFRCFVLQGLVTENDACRFATTAANAVVRFHVNGTLLIFYGMYSTDPEGITVLTVVFANNVEHSCLLS